MDVKNHVREHHERSSQSEDPQIIEDDRSAKKIAAFVLFKVGKDSGLFPSVALKAARVVISGQISRDEMDQLLDKVESGRRDGSIDHPGPYFLSGLRRMMNQAGVPWR